MTVDIDRRIDEHLQVMESLRGLAGTIAEVGAWMAGCIRDGGTIYWMGNGGSAADSQHMAAELVGRFERDRPGLASMALTTDTSLLTAVSNDYSFEMVFARQVEALCRPADTVVGVSTSGNSPNVIEGLRAARLGGARTLALCGRDGGRMAGMTDYALVVPGQNTARIQEAHIFIGHMLCEWIETELTADQ